MTDPWLGTDTLSGAYQEAWDAKHALKFNTTPDMVLKAFHRRQELIERTTGC